MCDLRQQLYLLALGMVSLLLTGCTIETGGGQSPPAPQVTFAGFNEGDEVAEFALAAPSVSRFVLRGTIPVPPGVYMGDQGISPFALLSTSGLVGTQVEVVSHYANELDGADVLEISATVIRPVGAAPGDRITYSLIWSPNYPNDRRDDAAVTALLSTPNALLLRTKDAFGHTYDADLLADLRNQHPIELATLKSGPFVNQVRTYENLEPVVPILGLNGTLPHMMGVHTYVTSWRDEGFISIELRMHNGHDGGNSETDQDDPLGKLYFENLELVTPAGWTLFQAYPTPSTGTSYSQGQATVWPIVAPIGSGKLHMMPQQAMFHRRFVLCKTGSEAAARATLAEETLAFCQQGTSAQGADYLSWWNPLSARYWAQNLPLPELDYMEAKDASRAELTDEFSATSSALLNGVPGPFPISASAMGWAHPFGISIGYMHGGSEIVFTDGVKTAWAASAEGYRTFQVTHRMYMERHPTALYDINGVEDRLEDWVVQGTDGPLLPVYIFQIPWLLFGDPWGFTTSPSFQRDAVIAQGRQPDYEATLLSFQHIDFQHHTRYTRSPKVLVWLGNDSLAKDDILLQAELARSSYSFLEQDQWGNMIVTGAAFDAKYAASNPGDGGMLDRGEGWLLDTATTAYAIASPEWRQNALPWFKDVVDLVELGQSDCSGVISSKLVSEILNGQYRMLQSISECILQNALWGMKTTIFDGEDLAYANKIDTIVEASAAAMIGPLIWDPTTSSPFFYTALGPFDQSQPSYCSFVPPGGTSGHDAWQTWNMLTFGYRITGDPIYLTRATNMAGGTLTPESMGMDTQPDELETRAGMIALLQQIARGEL